MRNTDTPKDNMSDVDVDDVLAAMSQVEGYLDITPDNALALYRVALRHAQERVRLHLTVGEFMTRDVCSVDELAPASQVARLLAEKGVSGAPVVENGRVVGVVSIKDFLPRLGLPKQSSPMELVAGLVFGGHCRADDFSALTARDIMTAPALCLGPDTTVGEAARLMAEHGVNRLPVTVGGMLAGIVTRGDVVRVCQAFPVQE